MEFWTVKEIWGHLVYLFSYIPVKFMNVLSKFFKELFISNCWIEFNQFPILQKLIMV